MYIFLIYGALGVWLIAEQFRGKSNTKTDYVLFWILLVLFAARFNMGTDQDTYYYLFHWIETPVKGAFENGFQRNLLFSILIYWSKVFLKEYRWFVLLVNLICCGLMAAVVQKKSRNILLSMLLFIGSGYMVVYYSSGIRQMIAMCLYLFGFYEFLPKKQYLRYEIFAIAAVLFHETALPALIIPLLYRLVPIFQKKPGKLIGIGLGIAIGLTVIFTTVLPPLVQSIAGTPWAPFMHILKYLLAPSFSFMGIAMEAVFGAGILILYHFMDSHENEFLQFEVLVFLFSVFIYFCFSGYSLMSRVSDFLQFIILILLPEMLSGISSRKKSAVTLMGLILLNGFLLFEDLHTNIPKMLEGMTLADYQYFTVFEKEKTDHFLELSGCDLSQEARN